MLYVMPTGVVELPSDTAQPQTNSWGELIERVAGSLQGSGDSVMRSRAATALKECIDYLNLSDVYRFGAEQQSDQALVENQGGYALNSRFFGLRAVQLVYTVTGAPDPEDEDQVAKTLNPISWVGAQQKWPDTIKGTPSHYFARNTFADESIDIRPFPDEKAVENFTLRIHYWTEIEYPATTGSVVVAPKAWNTVLVQGGKFFLKNDRDRKSPATDRQWGIFQHCVRMAESQSKRLTRSARTSQFQLRRRT